VNNSYYQIAFRKLGIITIIAVYILILIGGIVRSTGSGMGCPDWPKCFGKWVPPTEVAQLPENYKEIYAEKRREKNLKLSKYLTFLGFTELNQKLQNDKSVYIEEDFNVVKTWIEYINRLIGVLIGFLIILTLLFSYSYIKTNSRVFYFSLFAFGLVVFQGWVGSLVVSTNLLPGMITFHSLLATLLVFTLIFAVARSFEFANETFTNQQRNFINFLLITSLALTMTQVVLGTQVREAIDLIAKQLGEANRDNWVSKLGIEFYIHRSFSWLVLGSQAYLVYILAAKKLFAQSLIYRCGWGLLSLVIIEFLSGVGLAYLGMPAILQPVHLLIANLIVGVQFLLILIINYDKLLIIKNLPNKKVVSV
jgi:heme a synthase